jgi:hypothetical protein
VCGSGTFGECNGDSRLGLSQHGRAYPLRDFPDP